MGDAQRASLGGTVFHKGIKEWDGEKHGSLPINTERLAGALR